MGTEDSAVPDTDLVDEISSYLNDNNDEEFDSSDEDTQQVDDSDESDGAASEEEAGSTTDDADGDEPDEQAVEPPEDWSDEDKQALLGLSEFGEQGREAQDFLRRIDKQYKQALSSKGQELKDVRDKYAVLDETLRPWGDFAKQQGMNEQQMVGQLLNTYHSLLTDPRSTLQQLAQWTGVKDFGTQNDPYSFDEDTPERYKKLEQENARLRQQVQGINQQYSTDAQSAIVEFRNETDESGQLLHPHFDKVRSAMGFYLKDGATDMNDAYQRAVRADPELGDAFIDQEAKKRAEALRKEQAKDRQQKVKQAKKAGKNLRGKATSTGTKDEPLDDLESELARQIGVNYP